MEGGGDSVEFLPSHDAPRPIYSILPIIGNLLWRTSMYEDGITPVRNAETAYRRFHRYNGIQGIKFIAAMPSGNAARRFLESLPDSKDRRTYGKALYDAYKKGRAELIALMPQEINNVSEDRILLAAQNGDVTSMDHIQALAVLRNDEAGAAFWSAAADFCGGDVLSMLPVSMPRTMLKKYQMGKIIHEMMSFSSGARALVEEAKTGEGTLKMTAVKHKHCVEAVKMLRLFKKTAKRARSAIDTWTMVATRFNIVRDMRHQISVMLWDMRHEWAESDF